MYKSSLQTTAISGRCLTTQIGYNDTTKKAEFQVFNAFLKFKTAPGDILAGHNRIAFGLASYWIHMLSYCSHYPCMDLDLIETGA